MGRCRVPFTHDGPGEILRHMANYRGQVPFLYGFDFVYAPGRRCRSYVVCAAWGLGDSEALAGGSQRSATCRNACASRCL